MTKVYKYYKKEEQTLIKEFGVDIVRLWVLSSDYKSDVSISTNIISETSHELESAANAIFGVMIYNEIILTKKEVRI